MLELHVLANICIPFDVDEITERMLHSVLNSIIYKQKSIEEDSEKKKKSEGTTRK